MHTDTLREGNASPSSPADLPQNGTAKIEASGHVDVEYLNVDETIRTSINTASSLHTSYQGPVIPPTSDKRFKGRSIVLFFDGTGDQFDLDNSNVVSFCSLLKKGDRNRQLVYYHSGIGTYSVRQTGSRLRSKLAKTLDLMFANDLKYHVMDGFRFLMQHYRNNHDKICIFGFSRGAYTARALAGMIHKVGLLPAGNSQQVPFAYDMYKEDNELGWRQSVAFKRAFSIDVDIAFVGVWDTVASVGLLPQTLPFTKSNTAIKTFRHALSLDEHRIKFMPSVYQRITQREAERGDFKLPDFKRNSITAHDQHEPHSAFVEESQHQEVIKDTSLRVSRLGDSLKRTATYAFKSVTRKGRKEVETDDGSFGEEDEDFKEELSPDGERDRLEQMYLDRSAHTDVLEVWFAGCHCDIGGGSVPNDTRHSLARIPLRWMIRECFRAETGIQFEADLLRQIGLDARSLYPEAISQEPVDENTGSDARKPEAKHVGGHRSDQKHHQSMSAEAEMDFRVTVVSSRSHSGEGSTTDETHVNHNHNESRFLHSKSPSESYKSWRAAASSHRDTLLRRMEHRENAKDVRQPIYDQLKLNWRWWILEYLPMRERIQREDNTYKSRWRINRGRPRRVLQNEPLKVHSSVKMKMQEQGYTPRLKFEKEPIWVD